VGVRVLTPQAAAPSRSPGLARHGHGAGPGWAWAGLAAGPGRTGLGREKNRVGRRNWRGPNGLLREWAKRKLREVRQTSKMG
jgi:hypothetical protein